MSTWLDIISFVERYVASAARFRLSFGGKAYLIKAIFCAKPSYAGRIALPPPPVSRRITSLCASFWWDCSTKLVPRTALCLPRNTIGWSFPCVDTTTRVLVLKTILRVLEGTDHPARGLALYFLGPSRRSLVPRALGNRSPSAESTLPFYATAFSLHQELRYGYPDHDV